MSTALTSTSPPPKLSTRIIGIVRFLFEVRRRCRADVSAMDTNAPSCLFPQHTIRSRTTSPPRAPARASASAVLILIRLRSEETAQRVKGTNARPTRRTGGGIDLQPVIRVTYAVPSRRRSGGWRRRRPPPAPPRYCLCPSPSGHPASCARCRGSHRPSPSGPW